MPIEPIRILHLITTLDTGGAEMMLKRLVSRMDPERFSNRVVCLAVPGRIGAAIAETGIPVTYLGMRRGAPSPAAVLTLIREIRSARPDVIQTWLYHADLIGLVAGRLAGAETIVWNIRCSNMDLRQYNRTTRIVFSALRRLSAFPAAIIANSEAAMRYHRAIGYRSSVFTVIPNGFDLARFKPDGNARADVRRELGLPADAALVGCVGRFDPAKDHRTLIAAIALCRRRSATYLLCGEGLDRRNRRLAEWIEAYGVGKEIRLLGLRSDVPRMMAALDALVSSSATEGFPNVIGEAMACGVPCVVTDAGDSSLIVGDTGIVVPPRDPMALGRALEAMLAMPLPQRMDLGAAARRRIESTFDLPRIARRYERLYLSLVHRAGRRPRLDALSTSQGGGAPFF